MTADSHKVTGLFHITHMDEWDRQAYNMMGQAYVDVSEDGTGRFQFCAVQGFMDCRWGQRHDRAGFEFSWEGDDDGTPTSGRGWAYLNGNELRGHLYFHMGDDSGFLAQRAF